MRHDGRWGEKVEERKKQGNQLRVRIVTRRGVYALYPPKKRGKGVSGSSYVGIEEIKRWRSLLASRVKSGIIDSSEGVL